MVSKTPGAQLPTAPTVIVPLYVYPDPDAWNPLYAAVEAYPALNFIAIVNPNSGPGGPVPDEHYTRELVKLNSYSNVRTVGYVSTDYSKRSISLIIQDIMTYKKWDAAYAVTGIFFDETSTQYDTKVASILMTINSAARNSLRGNGSSPLIIHNPGTAPDARLMGPSGPDIAVVFEATYETFIQHNTTDSLKSLALDPARLATMIHSIPASVAQAEISALVKDVREVTRSVFVTELDADVYSSFGNIWLDFVRDMA